MRRWIATGGESGLVALDSHVALAGVLPSEAPAALFEFAARATPVGALFAIVGLGADIGDVVG